MTKFTGSWNPTENYLSQLGNSDLNPDGAVYFAVAMILGGLMMFLFYAGLHQRYSGMRADKYLSLALTCGFANAFSVIMSGTFSETVNYDLHVLWSAMIFLTFVPILILMNKSLGSVPDYGRVIHHYAYFVVAVDLVFLGILVFGGFGEGVGALMESLSVFTFVGWIGMFSYKALTAGT